MSRSTRVCLTLSADYKPAIIRLVTARMVELRVTQAQLARRMNVTQAYVSQMLLGKDAINMHALTRIAGALDADVLISLTPHISKEATS